MFRSFLVALLFTASARAATPCVDGQTEMSVEGVEGIFCVDSNVPICIASISDGVCPSPQYGLLDGSYCGVVATGVYGCKVGADPAAPLDAFDGSLPDDEPTETEAPSDEPTTDEPTTDAPTTPPPQTTTDVPTIVPSETPTPTATTTTTTSKCLQGQSEMSVEGVQGVFCVTGWPICMAETWNGACPGAQDGLPDGSYCGLVASGVYGCKVGSVTATPTPVAIDTPMPTAPSVAPAPASETPQPSPASETPQPAATTTTTTMTAPTYNGACGNEYTSMSIEGVDPIFCVREPACAGERATGFCPEAQAGLPWGSYCDVVRTGVYGCKPYNGADVKTDVSYPALTVCNGGDGDTPVSVVGAGTFCATQPVCAGSISGKCPTKQEGLYEDSVCAIIATGVYGCVLAA